MEAVCFSEVLVSTYDSTWRHKSDEHRHLYHCQNLKFYFSRIFEARRRSKLQSRELYSEYSSRNIEILKKERINSSLFSFIKGFVIAFGF